MSASRRRTSGPIVRKFSAVGSGSCWKLPSASQPMGTASTASDWSNRRPSGPPAPPLPSSSALNRAARMLRAIDELQHLIAVNLLGLSIRSDLAKFVVGDLSLRAGEVQLLDLLSDLGANHLAIRSKQLQPVVRGGVMTGGDLDSAAAFAAFARPGRRLECWPLQGHGFRSPPRQVRH